MPIGTIMENKAFQLYFWKIFGVQLLDARLFNSSFQRMTLFSAKLLTSAACVTSLFLITYKHESCDNTHPIASANLSNDLTLKCGKILGGDP